MDAQKHDLTCTSCGHRTLRVIGCGRPLELCATDEPTHYHCVETIGLRPSGGCDSECGQSGGCRPIHDAEMKSGRTLAVC